ncbi:MAG: hypothetical protein ABSG87_02405 [Verrucomicrobiota bacterium]
MKLLVDFVADNSALLKSALLGNRINMSAGQITARDWLEKNNYADVAAKIDRVVNGWDKKKTFTRRNWWDVIAGTKAGKPRKIEGVVFPILRAARLRQGWDVTPNCLCRNKNEVVPPKLEQKRWANQ